MSVCHICGGTLGGQERVRGKDDRELMDMGPLEE